MAREKKPAAIEQGWPAANIELWPLERIIPYDKNPRQHSPEQIDLIAKSMIEDGVTAPCLVDEDGVLIYGHGRRMAAEKNAFARYPVVVARGWSEEKKRAYRIKDNSYALLSTWSADLLRVELSELSNAGYDMPLLGFDKVQLVSFLSVPSGADPDRVPDVPEKAVTKMGDVWLLGRHRILCGDSTNADDVEKVLADHKPNLMASDPPYGVDYDAAWRQDRGVNKNKKKMGAVMNDDRADWTEAWELFEGNVAYIYCASLQSDVVIQSLERAGLKRRSQIIWVKDRFTLGRGDYQWQHEPCWYVVREGKPGSFAGGRSQSTTWNIPARDDSGHGHSTQKPVECMKRPIQNNSKAGEFVYEPFSGSGTTIIACESLNRYCLAIELNPGYVDVAVKRWQDFSKGEATLEGDGRTFAEIAKARKVPTKKAPGKPEASSKGKGKRQAAGVPQ